MSNNPIDLLVEDHRQIHILVDALTAMLDDPDAELAAIRAQCVELINLLRRHERREEEVLLPVVPKMGPIQLVIEEHSRLRALLDKLESAMTSAESDLSEEKVTAVKVAAQELNYCLSGHMMKEEQLAFKMALGILKPEQLAEMTEKMRAI